MTPVHQIWLLDLLDIFLVTLLFYRLLVLVKGTRSGQMYIGLLLIVLVACSPAPSTWSRSSGSWTASRPSG